LKRLIRLAERAIESIAPIESIVSIIPPACSGGFSRSKHRVFEGEFSKCAGGAVASVLNPNTCPSEIFICPLLVRAKTACYLST
jgi:hypothetical protein